MKESRLRWQCKRGMRELDELLLAWVEREYPSSCDAEKAAFRELLALPDPDLAAYLLGTLEVPAGVLANVVSRIRSPLGSAS